MPVNERLAASRRCSAPTNAAIRICVGCYSHTLGTSTILLLIGPTSSGRCARLGNAIHSKPPSAVGREDYRFGTGLADRARWMPLGRLEGWCGRTSSRGNACSWHTSPGRIQPRIKNALTLMRLAHEQSVTATTAAMSYAAEMRKRPYCVLDR